MFNMKIINKIFFMGIIFIAFWSNFFVMINVFSISNKIVVLLLGIFATSVQLGILAAMSIIVLSFVEKNKTVANNLTLGFSRASAGIIDLFFSTGIFVCGLIGLRIIHFSAGIPRIGTAICLAAAVFLLRDCWGLSIGKKIFRLQTQFYVSKRMTQYCYITSILRNFPILVTYLLILLAAEQSMRNNLAVQYLAASAIFFILCDFFCIVRNGNRMIDGLLKTSVDFR